MQHRLIWIAVVAVVACACPSKGSQTPGAGSGVGSGNPVVASDCTGVRGKVEQLYRTEAQAKEPKRVEEAVADNTAMVLGECAKAPAQVVACIDTVTTLGELEAKCLRALDDEGTEGKELRK